MICHSLQASSFDELVTWEAYTVFQGPKYVPGPWVGETQEKWPDRRQKIEPEYPQHIWTIFFMVNLSPEPNRELWEM